MKKLVSVIVLMVITLSILLSSCTEEPIKVTGEDNSGKGRRNGDF